MMILKLHELQKPIQISVAKSEHLPRDHWFDELLTALGMDVGDDFFIKFTLEREKDTIFIQGHMKGNLHLTCSRCAGPMSFLIDEFFSPVFVHGREPGASSNKELHASELDVTYFQGDEFSVTDMVREQLLLLLPLQPLCQTGCLGMCSQCGQNLNEKQCTCKEKVHFSPFHVLKDLKV